MATDPSYRLIAALTALLCGYCVAAVARTSDLRSLGIDAEPAVHLPRSVVQRIALGDELTWPRARPHEPWDRLIFSAKKSVYKAWHPLTSTWLDFEDVAERLGYGSDPGGWP